MRIEKVYDFLGAHRGIRRWGLVLSVLVLAGLVCTLHFSEDISDFLPVGTSDREALNVYQKISGAEGLYILFSNPGDPDRTIEAMDSFAQKLLDSDSGNWCSSLTWRFDMDKLMEVSDFVYDNIPYFLTENDYRRIDSLLNIPGYVRDRIAADRQLLMVPSGTMAASSVRKDPLSLFGSVMSVIGNSGQNNGFEMYGGCIFTPDMSRAVAMMDSPFGNSETEYNNKLLKLIENAADGISSEYPDIDVHVVGGPAVAVGNSERIKKDSILAIALSLVLIIIILAYSFNSLKNILLIFLSIGWGLLFALGGIALLRDNVSIIVIGISSIILGIAVNYPLHLIAHTAHQSNIREALKEIAGPLVTGNITTVGAFLALVPLKSTALRDLGLFASLLLVGTILFVLLWLPRCIKIKTVKERKNRLLHTISGISPDKSVVAVAAVVLLTTVLLPFSYRTEFDSNISNINYVSREQKEDLQYFEDLITKDSTHRAGTVYVLHSGPDFDSALESHARDEVILDSLCSAGLLSKRGGATQLVTSKAEQLRRLRMWREFCSAHGDHVRSELLSAAAQEGFKPGAFDSFLSLLDGIPDKSPKDFDFFSPITETIFHSNFTSIDGTCYVVDALNVMPENTAQVENCFDVSFDTASMSGALARALSDNFNYIGWACSLIVFFFLWFSFGSLELALISFLPMAVSWIWILGLMAVLGIKFNIVNIILATFIFGQGDDYTIFITEGCQYEYARGRKILTSYKSSILQSALIMFAGIGTLIVARHPAMHSLAQVTIIGMFSVVLMAYTLPPLLFRWMTTAKGKPRMYPITLAGILKGKPCTPEDMVQARYEYKGKEILRTVRVNLKQKGTEVAGMASEPVMNCLDHGYGELGILMALTHPESRIVVTCEDEERREIAEISASGLINNIEFKS